MIEWKYMDIEAPPQDGRYFVTNSPKDPSLDRDSGVYSYDGYGFYIFEGRYYHGKYWKSLPEKRYGKVTT